MVNCVPMTSFITKLPRTQQHMTILRMHYICTKSVSERALIHLSLVTKQKSSAEPDASFIHILRSDEVSSSRVGICRPWNAYLNVTFQFRQHFVYYVISKQLSLCCRCDVDFLIMPRSKNHASKIMEMWHLVIILSL